MFPSLYNLQLAAQRRMARTRTRERIRRLLTVVTADPEGAGLRRHTGGRLAVQTFVPVPPDLPPSDTDTEKAKEQAKTKALLKQILTWFFL